MSTIPEHEIYRFHSTLKKYAKTPRKSFVMDPSGDIHDYILNWLQDLHPRGRKTWTVSSLDKLYRDIELQRYSERASLSPYVLVTSLLNVHRKMMLWSHPDSWPEDGSDKSFWQEFGDNALWRPIWRKVLEVSRSQGYYLEALAETGDGRDADQAFCNLIKDICDGSTLTGSTAKIVKFRGNPAPVKVTVAEDTDRKLNYPWKNNWDMWLPSRDPLPMHPNTRRHEGLDVWARLEFDSSSSESSSESSSDESE